VARFLQRATLDHSKKSLAVDIKQARGRQLIQAIVPKIDVLVENFTPGVMARAGLEAASHNAAHMEPLRVRFGVDERIDLTFHLDHSAGADQPGAVLPLVRVSERKFEVRLAFGI
jgi:CoA-transferase family III